MAKWKDRICSGCGESQFTASSAQYCLKCQKENKKKVDIEREVAKLSDWGYEIISGPERDKFGHRSYKLLTSCKHEWEAPFTNIIKLVKNAQAKNLPMPCGECGSKRRMQSALEGYMEIYGVDYDLTKANDYRKKVRSLTEVVYRNNIDKINPLKLKRGPKHHHVDHVVSIIECFKQGWAPEKAAAAENLQMLWWEDNLSKGR